MAFTSDLSEEDALLRARIDDACQLCEWRSCPRFVGFLDEHRQAVARAVLREKGEQNFCFLRNGSGNEHQLTFAAAEIGIATIRQMRNAQT